MEDVRIIIINGATAPPLQPTSRDRRKSSSRAIYGSVRRASVAAFLSVVGLRFPPCRHVDCPASETSPETDCVSGWRNPCAYAVVIRLDSHVSPKHMPGSRLSIMVSTCERQGFQRKIFFVCVVSLPAQEHRTPGVFLSSMAGAVQLLRAPRHATSLLRKNSPP